MTTNRVIKQLVDYGLKKELFDKEDLEYIVNQLLGIFATDDFIDEEVEEYKDIDSILDDAFSVAIAKQIVASNDITNRDLFASSVMGVLTMRPSDVIKKFQSFAKIEDRTTWFYQYAKDTNYIMEKRVSKNLVWNTLTEVGNLVVTINRSKPEKDPLEIERAKHMKASSYPKCLLCKENQGYRGRLNHPGRQNLRTIPVKLDGEHWRMQYSPYVYYNEHAIILCDEHQPMKFSRRSLKRLIDFVDQYPHYFIGSNADLPLVGGSILSHDHYQGGRYHFPIEDAEITGVYKLPGPLNVRVETLKWPLTTLRVKSINRRDLIDGVMMIFDGWIAYNDSSLMIESHTKDVRHNTITPIVRIKDGVYECDVVLRNNRKNDRYPHGIFHPHADKHHIKKENIGLIEVMGLAVLPARLVDMMDTMTECLENERDDLPDELSNHQKWYDTMKEGYKSSLDTQAYIQDQIGCVFLDVLKDAGVYKLDTEGQEGLRRFLNSLALQGVNE